MTEEIREKIREAIERSNRENVCVHLELEGTQAVVIACELNCEYDNIEWSSYTDVIEYNEGEDVKIMEICGWNDDTPENEVEFSLHIEIK